MQKLAVLVSGTGSILEAILKNNIPVSLVLADRKCRGLEIAAAMGVPAELVERTNFGKNFDRIAYTNQVLEIFLRYRITLVALAGYMTILARPLFDCYAGRILNTHPSLLPAFKGANAVQDALESGETITGCTVHVATPDLDAGPIIAQEPVPILPGDTKEILHERIKKVERTLYPRIIQELLGTPE